MQIIEISAEETYPLRQNVLRPGKPLNACIFEGDERVGEKDTLHLGMQVKGEVVSILSLYARDMSGKPSESYWHIRGVATAQQYRQQGLAGQLLRMAESKALAFGGECLWCNARLSAQNFYAKRGFLTHDEEFMVENVGIHVRMAKFLIP